MFSGIFGSPTAIERLATCFIILKSKQAKNVETGEEENYNTLLKLYKLMKCVLTELYENQRVPATRESFAEVDEDFTNNDFAITVTTMMVYELLGRPSTRNLLHLMSFFPGGLRKENLQRIWSPKVLKTDLGDLIRWKLINSFEDVFQGRISLLENTNMGPGKPTSSRLIVQF